MRYISNNIKNKFKKLSINFNSIFAKKFIESLQIVDDNIINEFNQDNYDKLISQLPFGIYKNINEIITIIKDNAERNINTSSKFSTMVFNRKEFNSCKSIDYYQGNIITGRDSEVEKITNILCRKEKRGIILVGHPGIGKTKIVHLLDSKLKEDVVPRPLRGCYIHNMDIPYIFSNHKEDPLGVIIKILEIANIDDKHILFIDEVHQLLNQRMNDVLKPYLTGKLRFIGATTIDEYHSIINNDKALERRFNVIYVDEPSIEETISMVTGTKSIYENYHKCSIPDDICKYIVVNGSRFLGHRKNPDKSLDILDTASTLMNTIEINKDIKNINIINNFENLDKERELIVKNKTNTGKRELTKYYVDLAISKVTNVDYGKIRHSLNYKYISDIMKKHIFGQDSQLDNLSNIVNILQHINYNREKPISTILLVGSTGCGKTESAKKLCELIYGSNKNFIDCDLSGLTSSHMISELKGSPPGYVGYGKSGRLIKDIKNNPQSIIYLRNPLDCHLDILNYILLGIKTGKFVGGDDQEAKLNNAVIIFAVTLNDKEMIKLRKKKKENIGFGPAKKDNDNETTNIKEVIDNKITDIVDSTIIFNDLDSKILTKIYNNNIDHYLKMFKDVNIDLKILKRDVLKDCKNGHDIINKLSTLIPKMIFTTLKNKKTLNINKIK